ncbi:MAG: ferritin family protein [Gammaproteobacteria bacterium]|nr:ferritin family protein [Gammaproteobacteria bacterium]
MNSSSLPYDSIETFLAHAYALEDEATDRYDQLADALEIHNNLDVANIFRELSLHSQRHTGMIMELAKGLTLPKIAPWELTWRCPEGPESDCMEGCHYLMNAAHALTIAMHNEERAQNYYTMVRQKSSNNRVQELAQQLETQETKHLKMLGEWIERIPESVEDWRDDPDPANMPE